MTGDNAEYAGWLECKLAEAEKKLKQADAIVCRYAYLRDNANEIALWVDRLPYLHGDDFDAEVSSAMLADGFEAPE